MLTAIVVLTNRWVFNSISRTIFSFQKFTLSVFLMTLFLTSGFSTAISSDFSSSRSSKYEELRGAVSVKRQLPLGKTETLMIFYYPGDF